MREQEGTIQLSKLTRPIFYHSRYHWIAKQTPWVWPYFFFHYGVWLDETPKYIGRVHLYRINSRGFKPSITPCTCRFARPPLLR